MVPETSPCILYGGNTMFVPILIAVLGFMVSAIAVKHASYILMHGSVFESLRNFIKKQMEDDVFGFEKLNELFTCKVCMNTQVALWMVAFPLLLSGNLSFLGTWMTAPIFAVTLFSVSGMATWFWNLSEFRSQKFHELEARHQSELTLLRKAITKGGSDYGITQATQLQEQQFFLIVEAMEMGCRGIGCGYRRRDCRQNKAAEMVRRLIKNQTLSPSFEWEGIPALEDVLPDYFRDRWRYKRDDTALEGFRRRTFDRFREQMLARM